MSNQELYTRLLLAYSENRITLAEEQELWDILDAAHDDDVLEQSLAALHQQIRSTKEYDKQKWQLILLAIFQKTNTKPPPKITGSRFQTSIVLRWTAAAAILLISGLGIYHWKIQKETPPIVTTGASRTLKNAEISAGTRKARLTLSNGRQIELDDRSSRTIADGAVSIDNNNGGLKYQGSAIAAVNTMTTPGGGQYKLTLADGSRVFLNAASSITYPTAFNGKYREVTVTGEAYFEVVTDKERPFIVKTPEDSVIVLGTEFNINAYPDEPAAKTSLINGAVKVNGALLRPGQAYSQGKIISTTISQDIAWMRGVFDFTGQPLDRTLRQLARWYDVDIRYAGKRPAVHLSGEIGRNLTLSEVLDGLEGMGLKTQLINNNKTLLILE